MQSIPIEKFDAEYRIPLDDGRTEWHPCEVVGISVAERWSDSHFVILIEGDDGLTYPTVVDGIRRWR